MHRFKLLGPLALVLGLITAAPAAAGGDAGPPLYPSVVNVRLVRTEAALQRAVEYVDTAQADKAIAQMTIARSQMRKAWTGAKYLIDHAPPPVAGSGLVTPSMYARARPSDVSVFGLTLPIEPPPIRYEVAMIEFLPSGGTMPRRPSPNCSTPLT